MPIYEYECTECGKTMEALQKFSDDPLTTCEFCSGKLRKLISNSSFHLKGTGWYVTDYAGKNASASKDKTESKTESSCSAGCSAGAGAKSSSSE
ncbi:putative regulatory protein, FmdB family [Desulfatibacillum alkenivorans DSM 16219]|uniref:Putative regulatory protein, FmdB family n=1 Tax=Desulfatibacillum alkenivorans DSM 16219 TaxID=1121393 RepID=A0A1M6MVV4_9BACT|nr:FmdB family zinc ribbon protein [Desulfatibacillum alkenivorans]SHJ87519.1 putative regulatory protein, FmdB family [Desulfatibacillum alkenivorans DSM 16219]